MLALATKAAFSTLRIVGPSVTELNPNVCSFVVSSEDRPPSGPINIKNDGGGSVGIVCKKYFSCSVFSSSQKTSF